MSAINKKNVGVAATPRKFAGVEMDYSHKGNLQYVKADAQQLYEIAVSALLGKDTFHESGNDQVKRAETAINNLVRNGQCDFVANVIVHARTVMLIRSMPIMLTVYFAKALRDNNVAYPLLRRVVRDVIQRADQITDMYAAALTVFGEKGKIPMAIKRGVGDAFNKYNEYSISKYNRSTTVKFRDVLRIVHPTAVNASQGKLFQKIMEDTLSVPYTWETELSVNGQKDASERKSSKDLWTELVASGKVGYMALLRNLRNIVEADVDMDVIQQVASTIGNADNVAKSKQFPFAFVKAARALGDDLIPSSSYNGYGRYNIRPTTGGNNQSKFVLRDGIFDAVDASLGNLPQIGDAVWLIVDCSGSMQGNPFDTAALLASALSKASKACKHFAVTLFSDNAKTISVRRSDSVMTIYESLIKHTEGGGTRLDKALDQKPNLGFEPDTVVLLSDMQVDQLTGRDPMKMFKKDVIKIAINLNSYDTTPVHERGGWYQLSGWSEKMFDWIPAMRAKESIVEKLSVPYQPLEVKVPKNYSSDVDESVEAA